MTRTKKLDLAFAALLFALCASVALRPLVAGDDVWAHAAAGRWMLQNRAVPYENLFLWSAPHFAWIAHSWLAQVVFAALLLVGPAWLLGFSLAMSFAPFALLWSAARNRSAGIMLVFVCAVFAAMPRFDPRPELFSALFLVALLLLLNAANPRHIWRVALLFVVWANFHGAVALGLVLLWITAIVHGAQYFLGRKRDDSGELARRARCIFGFACVGTLATLCNPYGAELWRALVPIQSQTFAQLDEWRPLFASPSLPIVYSVLEIALAVVAVFLWARNPKRQWAQLAWLMVMGAAFVGARRHLWLFALVALAVIVFNAREEKSENDARRNLAFIALATIGATWCFLAASASGIARGVLSADISRDQNASNAVTVVRAHNGRVFNSYGISSVMQWKLHGNPPLFIDLLNAYPDSVLRDALDISQANARGKTLLQTKKINCVLLAQGDSPKLARFLETSPRWHKLYDKTDGRVWILH